MKFMVVVHTELVSHCFSVVGSFISLVYMFKGTYAGPDGSRKPTELELKVAEHQGSHFTQVATALKIGRAALPPKEATTPDPKQH